MIEREHWMDVNHDFKEMFDPKAIAVVGASRSSPVQGWTGMLGCIRQFGFPGRIYPINPNADEIDGLKAYPSLVSLPEPVDLVVMTVQAHVVPDALKDCIASGNKNVHIFTAGFKETGEEEGIRLQREIEEIATAGGLRVIGPNCMGLYVPRARLVTWSPASTESGPVAFVTQSGGHAGDFAKYAAGMGIHFSKAISYGNALTLDSTDFLEYLADDPETGIIAMYLEGVKDGRKLLRQVREINRTKPVVILKGGLTDSGSRAVASHTGSLAGGARVWDAFFKQTGAVPVGSLEEIADVVLAFLHLAPFDGRRVAIMGTGGGIGVAAADACSREGLDVPPMSAETMRELRSFVPPAGNSIRNPLDVGNVFFEMGLIERALKVIAADPQVDALIISIHIDWMFDLAQGDYIEKLAQYLATAARGHVQGKPYVVSWRCYRSEPGIEKAKDTLHRVLLDAGVPLYHGFERAARALARFAAYHRFQREVPD